MQFFFRNFPKNLIVPSKQINMKSQILPSDFFKKTICAFLIFPLFALFFGCNNAPSESESQMVEIVFAGGEDDGGTVQPLIDKFNQMNEGKIKVTWKKGARVSDDFYKEVVSDFKNNVIDLAGTDVIWTPALVAQGLVEDVTTRFFESHEPADFIDAAMESVSYQYKVWGMPWFSDAGILYYRKDLLEAANYKHPPATWDELTEYAKFIMKESGIKHGYVFQGAPYEGGVTNACEFIWNAEGNILLGDLPLSTGFDVQEVNTDIITVNSKEAKRGLGELEKLSKSGILPPNISEFKERETGEAFQNGEAVFMRSWAGAYGVLAQSSNLSIDKIGLTPMPTSGPNMTPYSCLGGWNLMINAKSSEEEKNAAWEFIRFMTSPESQKFRATKGGILPCLRSLYLDDEFLDQAPVANFARQVLPISKERPRSPHYLEMSPEIATVYTQILKGEVTSDEGVEIISEKLKNILKKQN